MANPSPKVEAVVYSDGSRFDEGGPVGWGCEVSLWLGARNTARIMRNGKIASNSVVLAELHAALMGVQIALEHGATSIVVYTDSTTIINLAKSDATPSKDPAIVERTTQLKIWQAQAEIHWVWIRAHQNGRGLSSGGGAGNHAADQLARQALLD